MKLLSLVVVMAFVSACGGASKGGASKGPDATCPATDGQVKKQCGCRPSEAKFLAQMDAEGPAADPMRDPARKCANGRNPGVMMAQCLKPVTDGHLAISSLADIWASVAKDVDDGSFNVCFALYQGLN